MKYLFIIILISLFSCNSEVLGSGYYYQQEVYKNPATGGTEFVTWVWHGTDLVKSYRCPIDSVNDSTKIKQRVMAEKLIENLQK